MQTTTHYALQKPDPNDTYNKATDNSNMDAIDTQMYNNAQAAAAAQTVASNAQTTANAATAPGAANDTVIGNRTADPTQAPNGLTGTLTQFLSWIANRIKAITGTANWYDTPPTTLTAAEAHMTNTDNPHNVTAAQIGAISTTAEGVANGVATTDANNKVIQTANNSDKLGGQPASSYPLLGQANTFTENQTAPAFAASGLAGATAGARLVGGTTSGAPTSGTWQPGDIAADQTGDVWVNANSNLFTQYSTSGTGTSIGSTETIGILFSVNKQVTLTEIGVTSYITGDTISAAVYDQNGNNLTGWSPYIASGTNGTTIPLAQSVTLQPNTNYYLELSGTLHYNICSPQSQYTSTVYGATFTINIGVYMVNTAQAFASSSNSAFTNYPAVSFGIAGTKWTNVNNSASGTWTPASGSLNVAAGTVINIANVPASATAFMVQSQNFGNSGISSDNYSSVIGQTDPSGTTATYLWGYYGSAYAPDITRYTISSAGSITSSSGAYISVSDGAYYANILIQVNNGILQGIVLASGTSAQAARKVSWKVW